MNTAQRFEWFVRGVITSSHYAEYGYSKILREELAKHGIRGVLRQPGMGGLGRVMGTATQERFDFLTRWFDFATAGMQQRQEMEDARDEEGFIYAVGEEVQFALATMPLGPTRPFTIKQRIKGMNENAYVIEEPGRDKTYEPAEWLLWLHSGSIEYRELRAKMLEEQKAMYGR